jgi:uncharacterized Rmd1/YagE family protein
MLATLRAAAAQRSSNTLEILVVALIVAVVVLTMTNGARRHADLPGTLDVAALAGPARA